MSSAEGASTDERLCRLCGTSLRDGDDVVMVGDHGVHAGCAEPAPGDGAAQRFLKRSGIAAASAMGGRVQGPIMPPIER